MAALSQSAQRARIYAIAGVVELIHESGAAFCRSDIPRIAATYSPEPDEVEPAFSGSNKRWLQECLDLMVEHGLLEQSYKDDALCYFRGDPKLITAVRQDYQRGGMAIPYLVFPRKVARPAILSPDQDLALVELANASTELESEDVGGSDEDAFTVAMSRNAMAVKNMGDGIAVLSQSLQEVRDAVAAVLGLITQVNDTLVESNKRTGALEARVSGNSKRLDALHKTCQQVANRPHGTSQQERQELLAALYEISDSDKQLMTQLEQQRARSEALVQSIEGFVKTATAQRGDERDEMVRMIRAAAGQFAATCDLAIEKLAAEGTRHE
jgi:hypothetical protein